MINPKSVKTNSLCLVIKEFSTPTKFLLFVKRDIKCKKDFNVFNVIFQVFVRCQMAESVSLCEKDHTGVGG